MNNGFRLTTEPLQFVRYEVCTLHSEFNQHSVLTLQGLIDEAHIADFLQATEQMCVLEYINEDVDIHWHGIVKEVTLSKAAGQVAANVRVVGKTCLADEVAVTHTYSGEQQSLQQLVKQMNDVHMPKLYGDQVNDAFYAPYVIQYDETNWQFLKRQAAQQKLPLIIEEMEGFIEIFTDVQMHARRYELGVHDCVQMSETAAKISTLPLANKTRQRQFETTIYMLGERLQIENNEYIVCAKTYELHHAPSLQLHYKLQTADTVKPMPISHPLQQQTVKATVLHTEDTAHLGRIAVRFAWEQEQQVTERLYSWLTPFSANDAGFHALPEVGECVHVLFRSDEVDAVVYLAERTKPNERLTNKQQMWRTADGVEVLLGNQLIKLSIPDEQQSAMTLQEQSMRLHFQRREIELTQDAITIKDGQNRITLTKSGIELATKEQTIQLLEHSLHVQSGDQRIILQADGIQLQAKNIELQATNTVTINGKLLQVAMKEAAIQTEKVKVDAEAFTLEAKNKLQLNSEAIGLNSNVSIKK